MSSVWAQTYHLLQIRSRLFDTKNFDKIQWQSATLRLELSALENCCLDLLTKTSLYTAKRLTSTIQFKKKDAVSLREAGPSFKSKQLVIRNFSNIYIFYLFFPYSFWWKLTPIQYIHWNLHKILINMIYCNILMTKHVLLMLSSLFNYSNTICYKIMTQLYLLSKSYALTKPDFIPANARLYLKHIGVGNYFWWILPRIKDCTIYLHWPESPMSSSACT